MNSASRFNFALFRLFASAPQPRPGLALVNDRHQSAFENHGVSIWIVLTLAGFFAADLLSRWPLPLTVPAGLLLALAFVQVLVVACGLLFSWRSSPNQIRACSMLFMTVMIALAAYYARHDSWARYVAWQFLGLVALNAISAAILSVRRTILAFALVAPVVLVLLWRDSPLAGIGVLALSHALILYPTLRPNSQWLGPVVTRFATDRKEVWLTIDDGPADDTPALLDLLDRLEVKATFFVKGTLAEKHPDFIREMIVRGHVVANHSHTHPSATFWCLPPWRVRAEIDDCNRTLERLTGTAPRWFRAPVGHKNPFVHPALARRGMQLIGWTARGYDAVLSDPDKVLERMLPHVTPGAILVLHQGREHSLRVIERVVSALRDSCYTASVPTAE